MSDTQLAHTWQATSHAVLRAPALSTDGPPALFISCHGQSHGGERQARWMGGAVPDAMAAAFPDGFHAYEIRKPGRPIRIGHGWYLFDGDRDKLVRSLDEIETRFWSYVDAMIAATGADPQRVWLHGFSQGAYLTHAMCMRQPERVAGWIGQAGGFRPEYLGDHDLPELNGKPVLLQHGSQDEALPLERSEELAAWLSERGAEASLQTFDAAHVITPEMTARLREWLEPRI